MKAMAAAVAMVLVLGAGCEGPPDWPEDVSCSEVMLTSSNGLSFNGLSFNGVYFNGVYFNGVYFNGVYFNGVYFNGVYFNALTSNGLSLNGLSFNGLSFNGLSLNGLKDPSTRQLVEYTVSCALPADQKLDVEVDGETYTFHGGIGLAPEWALGPCDETCKGWISACLISRINARGDRRMISMRGSHPALAVGERERQIFTRPEATYFGDVSTNPPQLHACLPGGEDGISRVCGDSPDCAVSIAGPCSDVCKDGMCRDINGRGYSQFISTYIPPESLADFCGY